MDKLRIAVASNDGKTFADRHFGDANYYDVYDLSPEGSAFVVQVANETEEEKRHADPKKAKSIASLLLKQGVQVAMTQVFGPNIKRIKSKFVCVLTRHDEVALGLVQAQEFFTVLAEQWEEGEERKIVDLRKK